VWIELPLFQPKVSFPSASDSSEEQDTIPMRFDDDCSNYYFVCRLKKSVQKEAN